MADHLVMPPIAVSRFPQQAFDIRWLEEKTSSASSSSSSSSSASSSSAPTTPAWASSTLDIDCDTPAARSLMRAAAGQRRGEGRAALAGTTSSSTDEPDDDDDGDDFRGLPLFAWIQRRYVEPALERALSAQAATASSTSSSGASDDAKGSASMEVDGESSSGRSAPLKTLDNAALVREIASIPNFPAVLAGLEKRFASALMVGGLQPHWRERGLPTGLPLVPSPDHSSLSSSSSSAAEPAAHLHLPGNGREVVLRIAVFPRDVRQIKHSRPLRPMQEFEVLGSTPIQALRDAIFCPHELNTASWMQELRERECKERAKVKGTDAPACQAHSFSSSSSSSLSFSSAATAATAPVTLGSVCTCEQGEAFDGAACLYFEGSCFDDCRPAWRMRPPQSKKQAAKEGGAASSLAPSSSSASGAVAAAASSGVNTLLTMLEEEQDEDGEDAGEEEQHGNLPGGAASARKQTLGEESDEDSLIEPLVFSTRPRYGETISNFLNGQLRAGISTGWGLVSAMPMAGVRFEDLSLRLGAHYCFMHETPPSPWLMQEWRERRKGKKDGKPLSALPTTHFFSPSCTCEHVVAITDLRCHDPSPSADGPLFDAATGLSRYPRLVSQAPYQHRMCAACGLSEPELLVYGDALAVENPAHYCGYCFDELHPGLLKRVPKEDGERKEGGEEGEGAAGQGFLPESAFRADPMPASLAGPSVSLAALVEHASRSQRTFNERRRSYRVRVSPGSRGKHFFWVPYRGGDVTQTHLQFDHFRFFYEAKTTKFLHSRGAGLMGSAAGGTGAGASGAGKGAKGRKGGAAAGEDDE